MLLLTSGRAAGVIPPMPVSHGRFPGSCKIMFSAATRSHSRMRLGTFSISVCNQPGQIKRFTVTICGVRPTAVKPGSSSHPTEARAAIRHGLRSIGLTVRGTVSNTRYTIVPTVLARARHSNAPQTAALRGKALSLFRTRLYTELLTSIPTATCLLVVGPEAQDFAACARVMHRSEARH